MFLAPISSSLCFSTARCIDLFFLLAVLAPHDSNVVVYARLLTVLRVVNAIVRLSVRTCQRVIKTINV